MANQSKLTVGTPSVKAHTQMPPKLKDNLRRSITTKARAADPIDELLADIIEILLWVDDDEADDKGPSDASIDAANAAGTLTDE